MNDCFDIMSKTSSLTSTFSFRSCSRRKGFMPPKTRKCERRCSGLKIIPEPWNGLRPRRFAEVLRLDRLLFVKSVSESRPNKIDDAGPHDAVERVEKPTKNLLA